MLVQELDQSITHRRSLVSMAQKLDSEVAVLERTRGSVPATTSAAVTTRSVRGRRRGAGSRRDQQNVDRLTVNAGGSMTKDVAVSMSEYPMCSASSSIPVHSMPMPNAVGFVPPFSSTHHCYTTAAGVHVGLVMSPMTSVSGTRLPNIRFINGDDNPGRFPRQMTPGGMGVGSVRLSRGRQDSSSSTDSAETIRHLEHGTCIGDVDRYLKANPLMQSSAGPAPVHQTFASPSSAAVSGAQGMRFYFRPTMLSGVSFPASRSELEQYKQVVHESAHIPPTEASTVVTPKSQATRPRQRSPGRGRGRRVAAAIDTPRNVVPAVTSTMSMPRFFSVGVVPPSMSVPTVRGVAQPPVTAVPGMSMLFVR